MNWMLLLILLVLLMMTFLPSARPADAAGADGGQKQIN